MVRIACRRPESFSVTSCTIWGAAKGRRGAPLQLAAHKAHHDAHGPRVMACMQLPGAGSTVLLPTLALMAAAPHHQTSMGARRQQALTAPLCPVAAPIPTCDTAPNMHAAKMQGAMTRPVSDSVVISGCGKRTSEGSHVSASASCLRSEASSAWRASSRDTADITGVCQNSCGSWTYDLNCLGYGEQGRARRRHSAMIESARACLLPGRMQPRVERETRAGRRP